MVLKSPPVHHFFAPNDIACLPSYNAWSTSPSWKQSTLCKGLDIQESSQFHKDFTTFNLNSNSVFPALTPPSSSQHTNDLFRRNSSATSKPQTSHILNNTSDPPPETAKVSEDDNVYVMIHEDMDQSDPQEHLKGKFSNKTKQTIKQCTLPVQSRHPVQSSPVQSSPVQPSPNISTKRSFANILIKRF